MSGSFVFVNDEFVPTERAVLHMSDLAIQRGYGIFDFLRTVGGRGAFLRDHLDRFYHSAARMRLEVGKSREELAAILMELVRKNGMPDSGLRINLTGGYSADAYSIGKPNLVITQRPLGAATGADSAGYKLVSYPHRRQFADVKTLDYLMAVWLLPYVKEQGADDVLYHLDGVVSECPRSNLFVVTGDGRVLTPGEHVLKGVVRKHVLRIAGRKFMAEEGVVRLEDLYGAREVFITSTTKGALAVVALDGRQIGDGRPGEVTQWLGREFEAALMESLGN